jgi:UDP-GlcNAc:undecaprenyl-phosphate GlcNAc-1-phosphate transferase
MRDLALNSMNAFLLSVVLIHFMEKFAASVGLVDVPAGRKRHDGHIPLVGFALFTAFAIATLLLEHQPVGFTAFLSGLTLLVLLGVLDDLFDIKATVKLVVQISCVALMVLPNQIFLRHLGALPDDGLLPLPLAAPITIFAIVGLINAVNMMDGIDGLAGSLTLVSLFWFAVAADLLGRNPEFTVTLLAAFCVIGFLGFNLRHPWRARAKVFLGDAGSMMLGALLGFIAVAILQPQGGESPSLSQDLSPIVLLWICAIPIIDTASLIVRRIAAGRSPFSSDREHLHHLMLDAGLNESQAVAVLSICGAILGGVGVLGWHLGLPEHLLLLGLAVPVGIHIWFTTHGRRHVSLSWRSSSPIAKSAVTQPQPSLK